MITHSIVTRTTCAVCGALLVHAAALTGAQAQGGSPTMDDLRSMSLEELAALPVTTVQRRAQTLSDAPGSVYVITAEEIRRAGAVSLPEALRLAPNLQVARDSASQWAVSARGMNSTETANKLLVMVDSRSIYSPLHAGVFWDEEPVFLEDIERIEVVSGPGGALWGANAVNGVINVITKTSFNTHGAAGRLRYGTLDSGASARLGGPVGQNASYRVYGSASRSENTYSAAGTNALDDHDGVMGGARFDWRSGDTAAVLQFEGFDSNVLAGDIWGGYARGRLNHAFASGASLFLQAYYDTSTRKDFALDDRIEVGDVTLQYSLAPMGAHQIIVGGGYRHTDDAYHLPGLFKLDPPEATQDLLNAFVQDTITFNPQLDLTLGVKVEDSSYSGFEYMPSARLAWTPNDSTLFWGAVSRAVRTPVRLDRDLVAAGFFIGGPLYKSEELIAYEVGYRGRPADRVSLNATLFVHDYDDLRTTAPIPPDPGIFPAQFLNQLHGQTYGVETWADFQALDWWLLRAGAVVMGKDYELESGARDLSDPRASGNDPSFEVSLRSHMNLTSSLRFDAGLRWIDDLPDPAVPGYVELDARLAWRATDRLRLAIVGTNLLHESHPETSALAAPNRIRRGVFLDAIWGF